MDRPATGLVRSARAEVSAAARLVQWTERIFERRRQVAGRPIIGKTRRRPLLRATIDAKHWAEHARRDVTLRLGGFASKKCETSLQLCNIRRRTVSAAYGCAAARITSYTGRSRPSIYRAHPL